MSSRSSALRYYILSRLLLAPLMLWIIATVVFMLLRATPGDPVDSLLGARAPDAAKEALRERLGLNAPLWTQYLTYLWKLLHLDLGTSLTTQGQSVVNIIRNYFPATLELTLISMVVSVTVGVLIGSLAASRPNTPLDAGGRLFGIITYAVPMYWFGMLLQLLFAVQLRWFPIGTRFPISMTPPQGPTGLYLLDSVLQGRPDAFFTSLYHLVLPSLTLGILLSGIFERIVRVNLKQTLRSDYVEAARARGIPERRIVFAHALKNALIPLITVLGLTIASLLGGAILTEVTFNWPGLANRLYQAIDTRDYPVVQGIMVFFGVIVAVASILIDILNAWVDPRIRY
ncbi:MULTISPECIES: ABC transporter permease [unclassified Leptolyngbya]|uniref:ABC transporter permease n=1 Tax=unclassified Leptolyngbya TaxID=2650499 RepID=UPI0016870A68|nr:MULTISPECIES: ABC transporter permease [unclassified Leptolyngbya]MBD1912739.1 ABC transporter permease [Leptolyngbya sp. FACHB-8]MBD2155747.1 ABC transporter permease [Leptolyngbya sp. FACHB-16]